MAIAFRKAVKSQSKLRLALIGPSGSGKTYTALSVARGLGQKVAVIDTEHGSASKYADQFGFDVLELETFSPATYVQAIQAAEAAGYEVVVIDSLSHAWMGKDGALELVDKATARSKSGNSYTAWREVTPQHNQMIDAIVRSKCHIVATMRAKTEYLQEKDDRSGKTVIRKVGLAPVQRDGMEYEFDLVGDIDHEHRLVVTKSRIASLADAVIPKPGAEFAATLRDWLNSGEAVPEVERPLVSSKPSPVTDEQLGEIKTLAIEKGLNASFFDGLKLKYKVAGSRELSAAQADEIIRNLRGE